MTHVCFAFVVMRWADNWPNVDQITDKDEETAK